MNRSGPHHLIYLGIWSQLVELFFDLVRGGLLLVVKGSGLEVSKAYVVLCFQCLILLDQNVSSQLLLQCHTFTLTLGLSLSDPAS